MTALNEHGFHSCSEEIQFPSSVNVVAVELCLRNRYDIETCDVNGWSVLSWNLRQNNHEVVDYVLKKGGSIERAFFSQNRLNITHHSLEVIRKNKGNEFVKQIPLELLLPSCHVGVEGKKKKLCACIV